jgi:hypothetical protein
VSVIEGHIIPHSHTWTQAVATAPVILVLPATCLKNALEIATAEVYKANASAYAMEANSKDVLQRRDRILPSCAATCLTYYSVLAKSVKSVTLALRLRRLT